MDQAMAPTIDVDEWCALWQQPSPEGAVVPAAPPWTEDGTTWPMSPSMGGWAAGIDAGVDGVDDEPLGGL
jgi:hypothetical protein